MALGTSLAPGSSQRRRPRGQADQEGDPKLSPFSPSLPLLCVCRLTGCVLDTRVAQGSLAIFRPLIARLGLSRGTLAASLAKKGRFLTGA